MLNFYSMYDLNTSYDTKEIALHDDSIERVGSEHDQEYQTGCSHLLLLSKLW